jgi:hypothetical protein
MKLITHKKFKYFIKKGIIYFILSLLMQYDKSFAFGQDLCFSQYSKSDGKTLISNCINIPHQCRTDNLSNKELKFCKKSALTSAMKTMFGKSNVIGGRSMLHTDSTYYLAQVIGFTPEEAYQIAIYDEAADMGQYKAFDQQGKPILTAEEIKQCNLNRISDKKCWLITPVLSGVKKFNGKTGGMLFHLPARFFNQSDPPTVYPTDYLLTPNLDKHIANLRDWAFGKYQYACVGGVTDKLGHCANPKNPITIRGHIPFFAADVISIVKFNAILGEQIINEGSTITYSSQINDYVKPHNGDLAKLGLFLHALQDRYSHHRCSDYSYIRPTQQGYEVYFDDKACSQGIHMLSHAWEVGTNQSHSNLSKNMDHTIEPALSSTYDQLLSYAETHGIKVNSHLDKQKIIDELLLQLSIEDPTTRLNSMVLLFEKKGLTPLPKHGSTDT